MKILILWLVLISPNGDIYTDQVGPFTDERSCAQAAVRLVEVARRHGVTADGACVRVSE